MVTVARFILRMIASIGESGERTSLEAAIQTVGRVGTANGNAEVNTGVRKTERTLEALPVCFRSVDGSILVAGGAGYQPGKRVAQSLASQRLCGFWFTQDQEPQSLKIHKLCATPLHSREAEKAKEVEKPQGLKGEPCATRLH